MSDDKKYDGGKAQAPFSGREVTGPKSPTLETPETLLPEVGHVLTVVHEDGRRERRVVTSARFEREPGMLGSFVYETAPVEEES